jgi:phosphoribosyl 1,2-cyclic phosphodiesterase
MIHIEVLASSSRANCYRVNDGETPLLIECGLSFREISRRLQFRVSELAGCLVSHEHADHSKAAKDLAKAGIDVYASRGTLEAIGLEGHRARPVEAKKRFTLGSWTILPFDTVHDAAEPLGFLLASRRGGKLLFMTDSAYSRYRFQGVTHYMIEVNYDSESLKQSVESGETAIALCKRLLRTHFSLEAAVEFLKSCDLCQTEEIIVLHLSGSHANAEKIRTVLQRATGTPVTIAPVG